MQTDIPTLFVEINDLNYIFVVGKYDENQNLKIIEKIITPNEGIAENKFINIDLAEKLIKKAIKLDPENPAIIDSYGWVLFRLGKYDSALKELVKAYDLYKDPEIAAHIIEVLLVLDRKEEAKIRLSEAQNLFINNKYLEDVSESFLE